jgi:hypothetical protein
MVKFCKATLLAIPTDDRRATAIDRRGDEDGDAGSGSDWARDVWVEAGDSSGTLLVVDAMSDGRLADEELYPRGGVVVATGPLPLKGALTMRA